MTIAYVFATGTLLGLLIGWLVWGLPMQWAEDRGRELEEDGYTVQIVKKQTPSTQERHD